MNFNKICDTGDWNDLELFEIMRELLNLNITDVNDFPERQRKHWEWAIGMLTFKKAGKLDNNCTFLGIGSGSEAPIFYLTNHAKYVVCTDIYGLSKKWTRTTESMLTNPEIFAPGKFKKRRLAVQIMDGTDLRFEDNTFDGVFSYSSIEHFGGKEEAVKCLKEIERVLKPGGIASIATEVYVGSNLEKLYLEREYFKRFPQRLLKRYEIFSEMFTRDELENFVSSTNLKLLSQIDYKINSKDLVKAVRYPQKNYPDTLIFLDMKGIQWGSIHLVFQKEVKQ